MAATASAMFPVIEMLQQTQETAVAEDDFKKKKMLLYFKPLNKQKQADFVHPYQGQYNTDVSVLLGRQTQSAVGRWARLSEG